MKSKEIDNLGLKFEEFFHISGTEIVMFIMLKLLKNVHGLSGLIMQMFNQESMAGFVIQASWMVEFEDGL